MAYRSAEEFVNDQKASMKKEHDELEKKTNEEIAKYKEEQGYDNMSDEEKERCDEVCKAHYDAVMHISHSNSEKRKSEEDDSHEQREIER